MARPAAPYGRQPRTVSHVKHAAQLVFNHVRGPVAAVRAATGQPVVRKAASPHDFGSGVVVGRIIAQHGGMVHDHAHEALADAVRYVHVRAVPKIAFHGVHEDIHAAAGRLKGRQRHGQLRIHDGKGRTGHICLEAAFEAVFLVGHNG